MTSFTLPLYKNYTMYKEIEGNLITLAKAGTFDVITHGCNCMCVMGAGIAPQMAKAFGCDKFKMEGAIYRGDANKLGTIDYEVITMAAGTSEFDVFDFDLVVVNSYTQYSYGGYYTDVTSKPIYYEALSVCLRKINYIFKGKHIGLPQIGCGLAGGDWSIVKGIIQKELKDCDVTVVIYKP